MINERYKVKKKLGKGRSTVYLCEDIDRQNAEYAIKVLPGQTSEEEEDFFRNEFITLKYLNHPNIIRAFDYGTVLRNTSAGESSADTNSEIDFGNKFFTLEFFQGSELLNYEIKDESVLRKIITQICAALYYLHQSKYIYYDLKPENILIKNDNGEPVAKLIDLGFAERVSSSKMEDVRGSAQYIAPELLKKLPHDHKVDLYSLGMVLYRIIYGKFPFDTDNELQIYKAQIEKEFDYDESSYSKELVDITKKLLEKEPEKRYQSILEVLYDLNGKIDNNVSIYWDSAPYFADRKDFLNILDHYLNDETSDEIFVVKGFEGSGKSALLDEIHYKYKNSILIKNDRTSTGYNFLNKFLRTLVFNENTFRKFDKDTLEKLDAFLNEKSQNPKEDFNTIISQIARECRIIIILDDFNLYDQLSLGFIKDIIPILQVGKQKIILTENSEYDYQSSHIYNLVELNLNPFTESQLNEFLEERFSNFFPISDLKKVISMYSDFLPGNIGEFIKDLLRVGIISFNSTGVGVKASEEHSNILRSSHEQIYENRLKDISEEELKTAQILSLFNIKISANLLSRLLNQTEQRIPLRQNLAATENIINNLKLNNILQQTADNSFIQFTSENLREYIYSEIDEKEKLHLHVANKIMEVLEVSRKGTASTDASNEGIRQLPERPGSANQITFDNRELARQYELAKKYDKCYEILMKESEEAEKLSAYSYQKDILLHLLELPLDEKKLFKVKYALAKVYHNLGEFQTSIKYIEEIINLTEDEDVQTDLIILKGTCLARSGEISEGKQLLSANIEKIKDKNIKIKTQVEIAKAEFMLDNIDSAIQIAENVISDESSTDESKGRSFNILGLIDVQKRDNIDSALVKFEYGLKFYDKARLPLRISAMEMNIGNIYNFKRDYTKSEKYWKSAIELNSRIGNLEQEALLLMNLGNFHYLQKLDTELAADYYNRSLSIFRSIENNIGKARVLDNLGELSLLLCEYENALSKVNEVMKFLNEIESIEENVEVLFLASKIHYEIGNYEKMGEYYEELKKLAKKHGVEITSNYVKYLSLLMFKSEQKFDSIIASGFEIKDSFWKQGDVLHYFRTSVLIIGSFISLGKFEEAYNVISENNFDEAAATNFLFKSESKYLLGIISEVLEYVSEKSALDLYSESMEGIADFHVIELTRKLFFRMGLHYYKRGNMNKAKENFDYVKSIINLITGNFKNETNREYYLSKQEISECIKEINEFEKVM
jgi:serine/threonine protein kinase/tetratricopeptide (TPR) repeat protein